ncbi:MAG: hypothetical protein HON43_03055 [Alphaproteobacteria bacterium]|jgi:hypothetical protein|nr:hypothetical protein [Alphaproteobacteria bacterium]MBT5390018.1 hypothetical protein [Alphaproteobacteria bacterium]MBT5540612.1 hypothetical protein [Alphaproteobacteria bacterium]
MFISRNGLQFILFLLASCFVSQCAQGKVAILSQNGDGTWMGTLTFGISGSGYNDFCIYQTKKSKKAKSKGQYRYSVTISSDNNFNLVEPVSGEKIPYRVYFTDKASDVGRREVSNRVPINKLTTSISKEKKCKENARLRVIAPSKGFELALSGRYSDHLTVTVDSDE